MKGYTCSAKSGRSSGGGSSTGSNGSSSAEEPSIYNCGYTQSGAYPTRNDTTHGFFSWHNHENQDFAITTTPTIYFYTSLYNPKGFKFKDKDELTYGEKNPFDGVSLESCVDVSETAAEGELYHTWVKEGLFYGFIFYYTRNIDEEGYWRCENIYFLNATSSNVKSSAPDINYNGVSNKLTIGTSMQGKRIIEFYNEDKRYGYPTNIRDEETLNEMYATALLNMESDNPYQAFYNNLNKNKIRRWKKGNYTVAVNLVGGSVTNNNALISAAIGDAIYSVNDIMNEFGVNFQKTSAKTGNITITVDTELNLYDINPATSDYVYGGTWETNEDDSGAITGASIKLANDYYEFFPYCRYETVALEELLQCMGAGYDQVEYPENTMHTEFNYYNKPSDDVPEKDKNILRLLYSDYVTTGMDCIETALALNLPKGCYLCGNSTTNTEMTIPLNFLEKGCNYQVRVFIVNSYGEVSITSEWISVSTPEITLEPWEWDTDISETSVIPFDGEFHPVTAKEWNEYTQRLSELKSYLEDRGNFAFSDFPDSFATVNPKDVFTIDIYNDVSKALMHITEVCGYGYVCNVYTLSKVTSLSSRLFTSLKNQFNFLINCL